MMKRRNMLKAGFGAAMFGALVTVLPEARALQCSMSSDEWWEQNIPSERLIDVSSALTGDEVSATGDEVSALSGLNATSFLAAQGALDDGSVVRRVGVGANDGRYALILQLLSADGEEVVDSRVMRWADSADGGYIELQEVGRSVDSLAMPPAGSDPNGWADGDEIPCPTLTRPQWVCTKVDKGFFECCGACIWAGAAAPVCGLVWCSYCLWNHCENSTLACV